MRKSATWAACVAWLVPEQGTSWAGVHSGTRLAQHAATGDRPHPCRQRQQHRISHRSSATPPRRCYKRRRHLQPPLAAHGSDGGEGCNRNSNGKGRGSKRTRSSPYSLPLYEAAGPSSSTSAAKAAAAAATAAAASASEAVEKVDLERKAELGPLPPSTTVVAEEVSAAVAKAVAAVLLAFSPSGKGDGTMSTTASLEGVEPLGRATNLAAASVDAAASPSCSPASDSGATPSDPWRARLTLAAVACLYGTNYTAIKFMGDFMETSSLLTLRFGLAGLALLPALRGVGRGVLLAGAEVGVYATLGYGAQAYAMRSLPASQLALVGCLAVLVVPFLDQISGRRKAGIATISAAVLACGGAALLQSGGIDPAAVDGGAGLLPHALALMQPFFFGLSTWRMEDAVTRHPGQALALTASQVVVVAVTSALLSVFSGGFPSGMPEALTIAGIDPLALAVLLWLGLVNTALVLFLETDALESVSASEATVIYSLEPLVGAGLASSALGEPFPSPLGAFFVLGGCLCSSLSGSGTSGDGDETDQQRGADK